MAFSANQLSLKEQLPVLELEVERATVSQNWQQATATLQQALALNQELARNNALAREYAGFQMVSQARELEQARQQSRLQALAAEQQNQQRLIYLLALVSAGWETRFTGPRDVSPIRVMENYVHDFASPSSGLRGCCRQSES